jgi:hypothetical protein
MIILFVLIVGFAIVSIVWSFGRGQSMLNNWAKANGFRIIDAERRSLRRGPFLFTTGKGQEVHYVAVEDAQGQRRSGYVRCGGMFLGMMSDAVAVKWDDE